ncbi:MAG: 23S rRNA (cytidine(2498)-2'-O)-methyltransferase RlmM [Marinobacterium sp.]
MNHIIIYCRSGFESEAASEISVKAAEAGVYGYPKFDDLAGYIEFVINPPHNALQLMSKLRFRDLIFARQWIACEPMLQGVSSKDRLTPISEAVAKLPKASELLVESADTTDGRNLNGLAKKLGSAAAGFLRQQDLLLPRKSKADYRLHIFLLENNQIWVGVSPINNSSKWEQGIKRLKFPADAPSRSTLKLEEAWHYFIPQKAWDERLQRGMKAVDLGAAPGGWTYQLVKRGMFVTAVDNGPMKGDLMETGQVDHQREDAFTFAPAKPVDLMVCDVVDKPTRVIELMAKWAINGWADRLIFNLKLPMKKRYIEVSDRIEQLEMILQEHEKPYRLVSKHLYHDREEITCYLELDV